MGSIVANRLIPQSEFRHCFEKELRWASLVLESSLSTQLLLRRVGSPLTQREGSCCVSGGEEDTRGPLAWPLLSFSLYLGSSKGWIREKCTGGFWYFQWCLKQISHIFSFLTTIIAIWCLFCVICSIYVNERSFTSYAVLIFSRQWRKIETL